jgi:hypothetical protein
VEGVVLVEVLTPEMAPQQVTTSEAVVVEVELEYRPSPSQQDKTSQSQWVLVAATALLTLIIGPVALIPQ